MRRTFLAGTAKALSSSVRSAQTTEVFREAFHKLSQSSSHVSLTDIDQILVMNRVRPSLLLPVYEGVGSALGLVSRIAPTPVSSFIQAVVENSSSQQLNDSVREMQAQEGHMDVKETLKFHRDSSSSCEQSHSPGGSEPALTSFQGAVTQGMHALLKLSEKF